MPVFEEAIKPRGSYKARGSSQDEFNRPIPVEPVEKAKVVVHEVSGA